jgi:hypothetical protein
MRRSYVAPGDEPRSDRTVAATVASSRTITASLEHRDAGFEFVDAVFPRIEDRVDGSDDDHGHQ